MKEKELKINLVTYTGRKKGSRQGMYVYIRDKNGKTSQYKYIAGTEIDDYLKLHKEKLAQKNVKKKAIKYNPRKYRKSKKEEPIIKRNIKKGIKSMTIKNVLGKGAETYIKEFKNRILRYIVKDKKIAEIMSQEQNLNKLKKQLDYTITIYDKNKEMLAKVVTHGVTLRQAQKLINKNIIRGTRLIDNYDSKDLNDVGSNTVYKSGDIKSVDVKVNFRMV